MKRILVIDDDADARRELSDLLAGAGFDVSSAEDGKEGLRLATEDRFDLVVTDVLMPKVEGLEFILAIKKTDPKMKIVAISGGGRFKNLSFLDMAKKFGADRAFEKPLPTKQLLTEIAELVSHTAAA